MKKIVACLFVVAWASVASAWTHSPTSKTIGENGGSFTLTISGSENYVWSAGSSESWISVSRISAKSFSVTVSANTSTDIRSGNITINAFLAGTTASAQTWVNMQSCGITQAGCEAATVSPVSVSFDRIGGSASVYVTASDGLSWSIVGSIGWLTANVSSGKGCGIVTLTATENTGYVSRSGCLTIAGNSVYVSQAGMPGYSSISYSNLKGALHSNPPYYKEGEPLEFSDPEAIDGYIFAGWSPARISADMTGDVSVVASWTLSNSCAIANVSAKQRWPWNGKVDIQYQVLGDCQKEAGRRGYTLSVVVSAKDQENGKAYTAKTLTGDVSLSEGMHEIVWDLDADGIAMQSTNVEFSVGCLTNAHPYCVIDISGGMDADEFPISYLDEIPNGSWSQEYKTSKMVFRRVEGNAVSTLTNENRGTWLGGVDCRSYYIAIFELTCGQALRLGMSELTYETNASFGPTKPINRLWSEYRGAHPSSPVAEDSMIGMLNRKVKLLLDIPHEYQWIAAYLAGRSCWYGDYYWDDNSDDYYWNSSNCNEIQEVGTRLPNAWGLYDMAGNVAEFVRSIYATGDLAGLYGTKGGVAIERRGCFWLAK